LQRVRGVIAGILVGGPLTLYLVAGPITHAPLELGALVGIGVAIAIFAVVGTRSDAHDEAADAAWREVALDLPPVSDRIILARVQASMPGPEKRRRTHMPPRDDQQHVQADAASQGAQDQ
jgi:hypothetical protein